MAKGKNNDIDRLAAKLGVEDLNYRNINEHEAQLENLQCWPLYKEILELISRQNPDNQKQPLDYLKITR